MPGKLRISLHEDDSKFQPILESFWDGKCEYHLIPPEENEFLAGNFVFHFDAPYSATTVGVNDLRVLAVAKTEETTAIINLSIVRLNEKLFLNVAHSYHPTGPSYLEQFDKEDIGLRVLHQFLRQYGFSLSWEQLEGIFAALSPRYTESSNVKKIWIFASSGQSCIPQHTLCTGQSGDRCLCGICWRSLGNTGSF